MPTWIVDKNLSGWSTSFKAAAASLLPCCASASSLIFLEETTASSDMARMPFSKIKQAMMSNSMLYQDIANQLNITRQLEKSKKGAQKQQTPNTRRMLFHP